MSLRRPNKEERAVLEREAMLAMIHFFASRRRTKAEYIRVDGIARRGLHGLHVAWILWGGYGHRRGWLEEVRAGLNR